MDRQAEILQLREELQDLRSRLTAAETRMEALERNGEAEPEDTPEQPSRKQLRDYIIEVLENSNEPLTANEIAELLGDSDYKSRAARKNWPTMILQCLTTSPEFKRATRYRSRPSRYTLVNQ